MQRTKARQEIAENILAAIVRGDWETVFEQPLPQIAVEPEELFGAWLATQGPPYSREALQRRWGLFLRKRARSWCRFLRNPPKEVSEGLLFAVNDVFVGLWPGEEGNSLPGKPLRVTQELIDENS